MFRRKPKQPAPPVPEPPPPDPIPYETLREQVQRRLLHEQSGQRDRETLRPELRRIYRLTLELLGAGAAALDDEEVYDRLEDDLLGLGPLEPLLRDPTVTEILVNGPRQVFVERAGVLEETELRFERAAELMPLIERIVGPAGRRVDESSPMVDTRLPDGSRVNVIIPPLSLRGPCISIRKFSRSVLTDEDLVRLGSLTSEMADFLRICVQARLNIVVSGGTSTGKTTLLNVLSSYLPQRERIITIEDAAELQLQQKHVIPLEARPPNIERRGEVSIRQLVINALRMRPDRIVVGEVRGGEALDMLQAMNTGHDGSLATVHANSARGALLRLETMVLMAGVELPLLAVRSQIATGFDLVLHMARLPDGSRRLMQISEVMRVDEGDVVLRDLFRFVQEPHSDGHVEGSLRATGARPDFAEKIEEVGLKLPEGIFNTGTPVSHH